MARWLVALPLFAACYNPNLPSGSLACSSANNFVCPEGMHCDMASQRCVRGPAPADGMANPDGVVPATAGCSDGTREALLSASQYPDIAACDGAWLRPGIVMDDQPRCNRAAGNNGTVPGGDNCDPNDLCAAGWHVCRNAADAASHNGAAACGELATVGGAIYVTEQRGVAVTNLCANATGDDNNVYGCGSIGGTPLAADNCAPLARALRLPGECPPPWNCGNDPAHEGVNVLKGGLAGGGVLCCRD